MLSGSNVTVLCRSLSIPAWPFSAFNVAGCGAWWCSRMESTKRRHAGIQEEVVGGGQVTHAATVLKKPGNNRPFPAYWVWMCSAITVKTGAVGSGSFRVAHGIMMSSFFQYIVRKLSEVKYRMKQVETREGLIIFFWGKDEVRLSVLCFIIWATGCCQSPCLQAEKSHSFRWSYQKFESNLTNRKIGFVCL